MGYPNRTVKISNIMDSKFCKPKSIRAIRPPVVFVIVPNT